MSADSDRRLFWLLDRAASALRLRVERLAAERLGATAAQLPVVLALASRDGSRPGELAERLGVNAAAITGLAARMEAAGLLRRRPAPDDGRAQRLSLTAAGRRVAQRALPHLAELQAELSAGFSAEEFETVLRFLRTAIERAPTLGAQLLAAAPTAAALGDHDLGDHDPPVPTAAALGDHDLGDHDPPVPTAAAYQRPRLCPPTDHTDDHTDRATADEPPRLDPTVLEPR